MVEALAEAIIPSDRTGQAQKKRSSLLIDHMLAGNYGKGGNMYLQGPFVTPQQNQFLFRARYIRARPKTAITYSGGTISHANRLEPLTSMLLIHVSFGDED